MAKNWLREVLDAAQEATWLRSHYAEQEIERIREAARSMTPEQREKQRRSFAYGNANLSNPDVTREMLDAIADADADIADKE